MAKAKESRIVVMRRTIKESYEVSGCREDQAWESPFDFDVSDGTELDQIDYEVLSVEPNK